MSAERETRGLGSPFVADAGVDPAARGGSDYRASHVGRGSDYDEALAASDFDTYMARAERRYLLNVVPRLFAHGVGRYLDFACGTGRVTEAVAPLAETSIGVDVSATMLEWARSKCPSTRFVLHDITVTPFDLEPVDLVTSFRFLGNAQPALRAAALGALHDLVVPGGYLIVNNHRNPHSLHNALLRLRRRGEGEDLGLGKLEQLLSGAGFEPVATHGIGLWIIRNRLRTRRVLDSRVGRQLERLSNLPGAPRFCPDMVVVARRR